MDYIVRRRTRARCPSRVPSRVPPRVIYSPQYIYPIRTIVITTGPNGEKIVEEKVEEVVDDPNSDGEVVIEDDVKDVVDDDAPMAAPMAAPVKPPIKVPEFFGTHAGMITIGIAVILLLFFLLR